jgi:hypothetical protein
MVFIVVYGSAGQAGQEGQVGLREPPLFSEGGKVAGKGGKNAQVHKKSIAWGLDKVQDTC